MHNRLQISSRKWLPRLAGNRRYSRIAKSAAILDRMVKNQEQKKESTKWNKNRDGTPLRAIPLRAGASSGWTGAKRQLKSSGLEGREAMIPEAYRDVVMNYFEELASESTPSANSSSLEKKNAATMIPSSVFARPYIAIAFILAWLPGDAFGIEPLVQPPNIRELYQNRIEKAVEERATMVAITSVFGNRCRSER